MSAPIRVHRIVIESYPTPDGQPFELQPHEDYINAIAAYSNTGGTDDVPAWLAEIDLTEHIPDPDSFDANGGAKPGAWLLLHNDEAISVPALRRVNFFSKAAATRRLEALTAWGATGHVESSAPIEWPSR